MPTIPLNRIVALLTALAGLLAAIVVPLASLDTSSVVGVASGLGAVVVVAVKWLDGWQKHEALAATGPADADAQSELEPTDGDAEADEPDSIDLAGV